jgi:hypothetical protein
MADVVGARTMCADVKEVKTTNSKASAKHEQPRIFLQKDNARPHTGLCTTEAIATVEWTVLPYAPYSPDLAPPPPPPDFHRFGLPEGCTPRTPFCRRQRDKTACMKTSRASANGPTRPAYSVVTQRWEDCVDNGGEFVKK